MKFEHVDDKLWQAREVVGIIVTANSVGVYISVHWFVTAQHDILWQTVLLEQGCQVYMCPWRALLMGKKHDFVSKLLLFKTGKLYTFMLMEVWKILYSYLHSFLIIYCHVAHILIHELLCPIRWLCHAANTCVYE